MRIITVKFSAAADGVAVNIDRDCVLDSVMTMGVGLVSTDPQLTVAGLTASSGQLNNVIAATPAATAASIIQIKTVFPVSAGEVVFCGRSGAGVIQLFFVDPA